ncbi:unnamed protein product [Tenebrio molitor]|nr:unnamed protein product [Tenebrio molitor]
MFLQLALIRILSALYAIQIRICNSKEFGRVAVLPSTSETSM